VRTVGAFGLLVFIPNSAAALVESRNSRALNSGSIHALATNSSKKKLIWEEKKQDDILKMKKSYKFRARVENK
jgi:hypothetical protein